MTLSDKEKDAIRKRVEKHTKDPDQQALLIKIITDNPNLEDLILKIHSESVASSKILYKKNDPSDFFKTGAPAHTSSSPIGTRKINSYSNFSSSTPHSFSSSPIGSNFSGRKSGCFIATAAFGSPLVENVKILTAFRDHYLSKSKLGKTFINLYYRFSPEISIYILKKPTLKKLVRVMLIPIIWACKHLKY